jgi:hypothetical protein
VKKDVLRLQVSVNDVRAMEESHCWTKLVKIIASFYFREGVGSLFKIFTEVSIEGALHKDVAVKKIIEESIELDNVGVVDI